MLTPEFRFYLVLRIWIVFAVEALLALRTVFWVATFRFGSDRSSAVWIFKGFADSIAGPLVSRGFGHDRCSDLKSVEEGAGLVPIDVALSKQTKDLIDGYGHAGGIFDRGQQKYARLGESWVGKAARVRVIEAESLAFECCCLALVPAGQNMSTFDIHGGLLDPLPYLWEERPYFHEVAEGVWR